MQVIMYHYVRNFEKKFPNLKFLNLKKFIKQLDYFSETFGFLKYEEFMQCIEEKSLEKFKNKIVLTFDDATYCHYDYVFKVLKQKKLWGIFYIPTLPFSDNRMLSVHKIHLLCGSVNDIELLKFTKENLNDRIIKDNKIEEYKKNSYNNNSSYSTSEVKRILNYYIDEKYKDDFIDHIGKNFDITFNTKKFYITFNQIKKMSKHNMIFGSHTHNHPVMSKLTYSQQKKEIEFSFSILDNVLDQKIKSYCHPYGGFHSFNKNTLDILRNNSVDFSFNVEPRQVLTKDLTKSIQHLPRFDCNLFEYGKAD